MYDDIVEHEDTMFLERQFVSDWVVFAVAEL
jgi:hypothetical protein